jgi:aryl-alcohol dehydrogenase-like predicted oxidoreductase
VTSLLAGPLALGTMMFGAWGNTDEAECHRMVHRALDAGITLFDTADMYDAGVSELILGRALVGHRHRVAIATKVGNPMDGDITRSGLSRGWIRQACEDSLRRLQVDHIDLYQMHRPDPSTPIDETLFALDELVQAGKVGAIGTSTFSPAQLQEVQHRAAALGVTAPTTEQPPYSVLARGIEAEVLPVLRRYGVAALVWAPLNGGWLTGKYQTESADQSSRANRQPDHFDHRDDAIRAEKHRIVEALAVIAGEAGMSLTQLALAFVVDDPSVTAALIGPRTEAQLEQLLTLGPLTLPAGVRDAIDALVPPGHNVNPADAG